MSGLRIVEHRDGVRFAVHVQPRTKRAEVVGVREGVLWVRVAAPPVGGAANRALIRLLADRLDVSRSAVSIVRGETARQKLVSVRGVDAQYVEDVLSR